MGDPSVGTPVLPDGVREESVGAAGLLETVRRVADRLAEGAAAGERLRTLGPDSLSVLRDSGLFRAYAPLEVGGYQADVSAELAVTEAIARVDGSTAWAFMVGAGATARAASALPNDALEGVFRSDRPFPVFASQGVPYGVVNRVRGGVELTGVWRFVTGLPHCDWISAGARDAASGQKIMCVIRPGDVDVIDSWSDPPGLIGTGTLDFEADHIFVPEARSWKVPSAPRRGGAGFLFKRGPVRHMGLALGLADRSLTEIVMAAGLRFPTTDRSGPAGQLTSLAEDLGRAWLEVAAARSLSADAVWEISSSAASSGAPDERSELRLGAVAAHVTRVALSAVHLFLRHGVLAPLDRQHQLQRNLRDMCAAAQHGSVRGSVVASWGAELLRSR